MPLARQTAVVQFELPSGATEGSLPLTCERAFSVILMIDGHTFPAQNFQSPVNDEQWRDFIRKLRDCNVNHDDSGDAGARAIKAVARKLYTSLVAVAPELREFLSHSGVARRLVIQTTRPELHLLPWAAMFDENGQFLAAGDLSVVQSWQDFSETSVATDHQLQLLKVLGADTSRMTAAALASLPPEIAAVDALAAFRSGQEVGDVDILHLEEHGDVSLGLVGGVRSSRLADTFQSAKMALLWSCYSGAADSWGESPALCLHRDGATLVLSFLAELHNLDAKTISTAFYGDVFGPAASRDPESALVRIRCAKLKTEFYVANWASMTVYLRAPLDLSALPLNGPRVPAAGFTQEVVATAAPTPPAVAAPSAEAVAVAASWGDSAAKIAATVGTLTPGTLNELELGAEPIGVLPREAFKDWRGNVIRIDGRHDPLSADAVTELNLAAEQMPDTDASDRLVWFFQQIARYGAPLIVWADAEPWHMDFLKAIQPSPALTFLLLQRTGVDDGGDSVAELVDQNMLPAARAAADQLGADATDGELSAAYFAFARSKQPERAEGFIARLTSQSERLMLSANFVSRYPRLPALKPEQMPDLIPDWAPDQAGRALSQTERRHFQEDWHRRALSAPGDGSLRDAGRVKHELGYLLAQQGQTGAAEALYRLALEDLEHSPQHGIRWHAALGEVLRDWADLLSDDANRLNEARKLLARAMAVHSFHGRKLQMAYSLTTAAQIALTGCHHNEAIGHALDAANGFEECGNWDGWGSALNVFFHSLAETRETERMLGLAEFAVGKIEAADITDDKRSRLARDLAFERARAHWIAGNIPKARGELKALVEEAAAADGSGGGLPPEAARLVKFLGLA